MSDIAIIGGDSMIGAALFARLSGDGRSVVATTRQPGRQDGSIFLDLGGDMAPWPALPEGGTWVLCAAMARLADCRNDEETSRRINADAVGVLADQAARAGAHLLFLSTDKVFDGMRAHREADDTPCPRSVYGQQKTDAENILRATDSLSFGVFRLTKVLAENDRLLGEWCTKLVGGEEINPFIDMVMAPVPLATAVDALVWGIDCRVRGVVQVSGPRDVRYSDVAHHIAVRDDYNLSLIKPVSAIEVGIPSVEIPPNTTLDTQRLNMDAGIHIPDAWDVIDASIPISARSL